MVAEMLPHGNCLVGEGCRAGAAAQNPAARQAAAAGESNQAPVGPGGPLGPKSRNRPMTKLPRPRIQRAFVHWLRANASRFAVPVKIIRCQHRCMDIALEHLNPCLEIFLTWEIGVGVTWQGTFWDYLTSFEAAPIHTPQGYVCDLCEPEGRDVYTSREALWIDHLFEPFLTWVNEELVPARWLALYGSIDFGATWAKLSQNRQEDKNEGVATMWLPLWNTFESKR